MASPPPDYFSCTQQVCDQQPGATGGRGLYDCVPEWCHTTPENAGDRLAEEMLPDDRQKVRRMLNLTATPITASYSLLKGHKSETEFTGEGL